MQDGDRQQFLMAIQAMAATFRAEPSEALLEGYWMALDDLPLDGVVRAVRSAMRQCERMPSGSELRKLAGEMTYDVRAVHAWGAVQREIASRGAYASVDFDDPVINATIRNLGGWQKLCATESEQLKWVRKDFERIYASLCSTGITAEACQYLVGIHEQNNAANGYPVLPPGKTSTGLPPHCEGVVRSMLGAGKRADRVLQLVGELVGRKAMP